ncbi:hypothetical protein HDU97_005537 [Phlyctochytrium planicorne]|nr:hypothetical protein HDU97_005537 [Phlyctochytrium planicorne]
MSMLLLVRSVKIDEDGRAEVKDGHSLLKLADGSDERRFFEIALLSPEDHEIVAGYLDTNGVGKEHHVIPPDLSFHPIKGTLVESAEISEVDDGSIFQIGLRFFKPLTYEAKMALKDEWDTPSGFRTKCSQTNPTEVLTRDIIESFQLLQQLADSVSSMQKEDITTLKDMEGKLRMVDGRSSNLSETIRISSRQNTLLANKLDALTKSHSESFQKLNSLKSRLHGCKEVLTANEKKLKALLGTSAQPKDYFYTSLYTSLLNDYRVLLGLGSVLVVILATFFYI